MPTTIQNVIDCILDDIPNAPRHDTVDTIKTGDPAQAVTGVVTTFLATYAVIQRAVELGANLIISHEPTFYNHHDETEWLQHDPVYAAKRRLLDEHGIVVWRCHDSIHSRTPDGIITGVVQQLGWEQYADPEHVELCTLPPTTLNELVATLKEKMQIQAVRVVGSDDMRCQRVALIVGSPGGRWHIHALSEIGVDVIVCGETNEWDTTEYIRDALRIGQQKAAIVIGHANSEEAGMRWLADWLRERSPKVPVTHVPAGDPFRFA
ncbi:MAG TPA: Nif3-like dinuclear metal center hexameric protein [Roseiflexaceae bacterium]|jgi:putative NIF3 family GTP cyclohydrolase 1 type 2|nr:Nif3-like dinuclear metal center hexameric protein [Roseiflexaceae bacterium]